VAEQTIEKNTRQSRQGDSFGKNKVSKEQEATVESQARSAAAVSDRRHLLPASSDPADVVPGPRSPSRAKLAASASRGDALRSRGGAARPAGRLRPHRDARANAVRPDHRLIDRRGPGPGRFLPKFLSRFSCI
jgi:hypothetical protein